MAGAVCYWNRTRRMELRALVRVSWIENGFYMRLIRDRNRASFIEESPEC